MAQACLYLAAKAEECPVQVQRIKQYMDTRQKRELFSDMHCRFVFASMYILYCCSCAK